ncbi:hypothetical protein EI42_00669 [Thermosporothrix hazakensis]|uniref:MalT-like TPR region domain-containing protein n=1 Tax=Thermosporothrix hazakensis TaxID=644383 RepID=A0A326UVD3_THEHA|nr:hypothetical protein [Thermosporothrix hazakensis]PZW36493.1 hypothetical protein EI42_00669 [Thermosporothrix hazakensis]GCE47147.1 hypothetical protein KTH_20160 [Thermosporothrix hazakensis]
MKVEELSQEEGVQLLQMLVPGLDMTEKAQQLVQAVAGLPLALELLGNYVRKQAYSGRTRRIIAALERIERLDERLSIQEPQAPTKQHPSLNADLPLSLRAVIAISEHQLPEQLQRAFYALETIPAKPNTFSEEMACAVMNCTVEQFHLVRDSGLLELSSQGRYTIQQTVHDYAWQRLHEVGGLEKAYCRLLAYLMEFGEMYQKEYELLQQECVTTLACLEQIVGVGKGKEFAELFLMYVPFLMSTAHYEITRQLALRAEAIGWEYKAPVLVVRALFYQGQVLQKLAHLAQAEECFRGALELAQQMNNEEYICSALTDLGWIESKRGLYEQAERHLLDGLYMASKYKKRYLCFIFKI